jgi:hypothetical protein
MSIKFIFFVVGVVVPVASADENVENCFLFGDERRDGCKRT